MQITNPVLKGFHPDPSVVRVGTDYYIATSTFEWYPGIRIYHSTDLVTWQYLDAPLKVELSGCRASDGIWAPHLSYDGKKYFIIYTIVHGARKYPVMDVANYLITSEHITGPWSEPVYLNSSGFDPSIFHDTDGKKWIINMEWDYRKVCTGQNSFTGILMQEYDSQNQCLLGKPEIIFRGTEIGSTEGPQIFFRKGWYYLVCAEGGTGWFHAVTVARSKKVTGPYEVHPQNPVLSSWEGSSDSAKHLQEYPLYGNGNCRLKKSGHGSFFEDSQGKWYLAHLCARTISGMDYCPLGRETAIQEIVWKEDWPYLRGEGRKPSDTFEVAGVKLISQNPIQKIRKVYTFENDDFREDFQTLRVSFETLGMSNRVREGYLRIYGKESIYSLFHQALLARRQDELCFCASTTFEFEPCSFQQSAGLIYRYDEDNQFYVYVSYDEELTSTVVCLLSVERGMTRILETKKIDEKRYQLGVEVIENETRFFYVEHGNKRNIGSVLETKILTDENAEGFTGAFVGMVVTDLQFHSCHADFIDFTYETIKV